jgi:hypothetical protein
VAVEVQRDPDAGVPQAFRDNLRVSSLLEHEAGVSATWRRQPCVGGLANYHPVDGDISEVAAADGTES